MEIIRLLLRIILFWIAAEILTFLHELGHAIAGLLLTRERVVIHMGNPGKRYPHVHFGRLEIRLHNFVPFVGFTYIDETRLNRAQRLWFYLGGPLMSLALTVLLFSTAATYGSETLRVFASMALIQLLITAIPMNYPRFFGAYADMPSDGMWVVQLLQRKI